MTTRDEYVAQLAKGHGFTLEQLELNRSGKLHPAQVARGRRSGVAPGVFLSLLAVLAIGGGVGGALLLYDDYRKPVSSVDMNGLYALGGGGVLLGLLFLYGAISSFSSVGRHRAAYARGQIVVSEGSVQKVRIRQRRSADTWRYEIGGRSFNVPNDGWELVTNGARYRVYSIAGDFLSIEPV